MLAANVGRRAFCGMDFARLSISRPRMSQPKVTLLAVLLSLPLLSPAQIDIEHGIADGVSLKLDARLPEGPGPFPAVILVHGGGWTGGDKKGGKNPATPGQVFMVPMHEVLTQTGLTWFSIHYRLRPTHPLPGRVQGMIFGDNSYPTDKAEVASWLTETLAPQ
jgi:acetyl esterase/lipase